MLRAQLREVEQRAAKTEWDIVELEQRRRQLAEMREVAPAPAAAAPPPVHRRYSAESQVAMDDLATLSQHARRLQLASEQSEAELQRAERVGAADPALRNELSQLYGDATALVDRGLDGIATADLVSGKGDARKVRKELVSLVEGLATRAKQQVERYDRLARLARAAEDAEDID